VSGAEAQGIHYQTAWTWVRDVKMPVAFSRTASGTILVDVLPQVPVGHTVLYARVSSHDQRGDLDRQVCPPGCVGDRQRRSVDDVVTEVGSAMSGRRRRFARLLADPTATTIVVERPDRLARFGVEYLEAALTAQARRSSLSMQLRR
jgi:putative resolvase